MDYAVLGPISVRDGDEQVAVPSGNLSVIMAVLIAAGGQPISGDAIAEAVYGDPSADRRRTLQTNISTLRSSLGAESILSEGKGWRLAATRAQIDSLRFEDRFREIRSAEDLPPERAAAALREILDRWRGHPYQGIDAHGALDAEIARLNELRVNVQAARIDAELAAGQHTILIGDLEALIAEHPYYEPFRGQHMLALYRSGRQSEALRAYGELRTLLAEELGVDPTHELRDLEQQILEQADSLEFRPRSIVTKRAVLVADPGDPLELSRLTIERRDDVGQAVTDLLSAAASASAEAIVVPAGMAAYVVFDDLLDAVAAAESAARRSATASLRLAIDWGDVEVSDDTCSGPPVARGAVLASVAHPGQVLLSVTAQQALVDRGGKAGLRFESLGTHRIAGLDGEVPVFQMLVGELGVTFPPLVLDRTPPPLPSLRPENVPGYELRDRMDDGTTDVRYSAYQPSVGREVIVQIIGQAGSSTPDFIRRFEADAQRLALFEHPNINRLLDYWRDPEGAYLVHAQPRGGSLGDASEVDGPMLLEQVGAALAYAHSYGVVHGALNPGLIFLDESGNARVSGFPVAGVKSSPSSHHAAYIAPETLGGGSAGVATDVYSLAILATELIYAAQAPDGPPASVDPAIERALESDPTARQQSVAEFLSELNLTSSDDPGSRFTVARNPYKGLAAFGEHDAEDFHGRTGLVEELVERLGASHLLAVVGPSGIGKSSVVRAGLIPRLRDGALPASEEWLVTDMVPGARPFAQLLRAIERVAVDIPVEMRERFTDRDPDVLGGLSSMLPSGSELLLVIDQLEEIFTLAPEEVAIEFMEMIVTAIHHRHVRIVATMRADFMDRPLRYARFGELLGSNLVTVSAPNSADLAAAITAPAAKVGVSVSEVLMARIIADLEDQPGALPLLQHTMVELFENRDSNLLDIDHYARIGGVAGSLAERAERIYAGLDPHEQASARQVFLRLVTVSEDGSLARRRFRISALDGSSRSVAEAFAGSRLLVAGRDAETHAPTIEVAHEALLDHWPRLTRWIDEAREDLALRRRLDHAFADWRAHDDEEALFLRGGQLAQHEAWTASTALSVEPDALAFLDASRSAENATRTRRRRARNLVTLAVGTAAVVATIFGIVALRNAATARERTELAEARELAASAINVIEEDPELAVLLAIEAVDRGPSSEGLFAEQLIGLREAIDSSLFLDALETDSGVFDVVFSSDGESVLLALPDEQAVQRHRITDGVIERDPMWRHQGEAGDAFAMIAVHPELDYAVLTALDDPFGLGDGPGHAVLVDLASGASLGDLPLGQCQEISPDGRSPYFTADGSMLGVGVRSSSCAADPEWNGWLFLDTQTWSEVHRFDFAHVSITENMDRILVDRWFAEPEVYSFPELELERTLSIEVERDGEALTTRNFALDAHVHISPDGRIAVVKVGSSSAESRPMFWDIEDDVLIARGEGFGGWFVGDATAVFTPDGRAVVASTEFDVVFDPETGRTLAHLQTAQTFAVAVDAEGQLAATAGADGARLWDLSGGPSTELTDGEKSIAWVNPDGLVRGPNAVVWGYDLSFEWPHTVFAFDPSTGDAPVGRSGTRGSVDQFPDGRVTYMPVDIIDTPEEAIDIDGTFGPVMIWDPATGDEQPLQDCAAPVRELFSRETPEDGGDQISLGTIKGYRCPNGELFAGGQVVVSADGTRLATLTADPAKFRLNDAERNAVWVLQLWDTDTRALLSERDIEFRNGPVSDSATLIHLGPEWLVFLDGRVAERVDVRVLDLETGDIRTISDGNWEALPRWEISPDQARFYVVTAGSTVAEFDTSTWLEVRRWKAGPARARNITVSPDGTRLALGGEDGVIRIWDLQPPEPTEADRIPVDGFASGLMYLDEDRLFVIRGGGFGDHGWRIVDLDQHAVVEAARRDLRRGFTADECVRFDLDPCPTLADIQSR